MANWGQVKYLLEILRDLKTLSDAIPTDVELKDAKLALIAEIKLHAK